MKQRCLRFNACPSDIKKNWEFHEWGVKQCCVNVYVTFINYMIIINCFQNQEPSFTWNHTFVNDREIQTIHNYHTDLVQLEVWLSRSIRDDVHELHILVRTFTGRVVILNQWTKYTVWKQTVRQISMLLKTFLKGCRWINPLAYMIFQTY